MVTALALAVGAPMALHAQDPVAQLIDERVVFPASVSQGAMVIGKVPAGSQVQYGGRTLRVSERSRKLYADVGAGPVEIVHIGGDRFEAVGSDLGLDFEGGPFPHAVVLRSGPERRVASSLR